MSPPRGRRPERESPPVKMTIYLDGETRKALRIRAIQEGTSATKLVERLVLDYLKRKPTREDKQ